VPAQFVSTYICIHAHMCFARTRTHSSIEHFKVQLQSRVSQSTGFTCAYHRIQLYALLCYTHASIAPAIVATQLCILDTILLSVVSDRL
jgi:hypothetical protein